MRRFAGLMIVWLAAASCGSRTSTKLQVDEAIAGEIARLHLIDNHAHPQALPGADGQPDRNFDALPADAIPDPAFPIPFRADNPLFPAAWHALFGYAFSDSTAAHLATLKQAKEAKLREKGDSYPVWMLNQTLTDVMLANRVSMGRGLSADRFKWVPFVDMFLFPLNNGTLKASDSEHKAFFNQEEKLLAGFLGTAQLRHIPAGFDDYLTFVSHTLESWKSQGAVALKFELAYLRSLEMANPQPETAERVYSIYAQSSEPTADEYKILQDYLFRFIAREAGRLGLPVHIHSSIGAGVYFRDSNANPLTLESVFNDPALRKTRFVLLHSAWPFTREASVAILKPHVYVDLSGLEYFTYEAGAAQVIRTLLETAPDKVLYGSDASPFSETVGWEETSWMASSMLRRALGIALTGMMADGEITAERANRLAQMILRENGRSLYGL